MPLIALSDLPAMPQAPVLLGLDLGSKTIGVAASDRTRVIASPKTTLKRGKFSQDAEGIFKLMAEYEAGGLIIGLPLHMNGDMSPRAQSARSFALNLLKQQDMPICLWDERMTSLAADRAMLEADLSRKKRAEHIDAVAASLILQSALEHLRGQK